MKDYLIKFMLIFIAGIIIAFVGIILIPIGISLLFVSPVLSFFVERNGFNITYGSNNFSIFSNQQLDLECEVDISCETVDENKVNLAKSMKIIK